MTNHTPNQFLDLEICIHPRQDESYPVEITFGSGQDFKGYLSSDILPWISSGDPIRDGQELFETLFEDKALRQAWDQALGQSTQRRIRLRVDANVPELHALPWELLHKDNTMLSADANTPFSRYLAVPEPWGEAVEERPIRVLAVISNPNDLESSYNLAPLDVDLEQSILKKAFLSLDKDDIQLDFLTAPVTLEHIEEALQTGYHILHYVGHGAFNKQRQQAALYLQDEEGNAHVTHDKDFIRMLSHQRVGPRLIFFAACQSATRSTGDAFLGLAPKLVKAGGPAVVAMQDFVAIETARKLSLAFYRRLAEHGIVDCAMNQARSTLLTAGRPDAAVPVLFMRLKDGRLWKIKTEVSDGELGRYSYFNASPVDLRRSFDALMTDKIRGFTGRQFVFDAIDKFLHTQESGYFIIRGVPGIGKSALMAKLINDRGYIHHFNIVSQNIRSARAFLENTCSQLIARYGLEHKELPATATDDSGFLVQCLGDAAANSEHHPIVLAIDALDEADRLGLAAAVNTFYLPSSLPVGVYIVVTTRPLDDIRLQVAQMRVLDLEADSEGNLQDIATYIAAYIEREEMQAQLADRGVSAEEFVAVLCQKSQGNFMYLRYVLPAIEQGKFIEGTLDELPEGLMAYYQQHWRQMREGNESEFDTVYEPIVCILGVAQEPVTVQQIANWTKLSQGQVKTSIRLWREFLETEQAESERRYRIYHASFQDFLRDQVDLVQYDNVIAEYYLALAGFGQ